jgi:hypothetical protein
LELGGGEIGYGEAIARILKHKDGVIAAVDKNQFVVGID